MDTASRSVSKRGLRCNLHRDIARQRERVLDLEIVVDDSRASVEHEVAALRLAVRERDRAAAHLAQLITWHSAITPRVSLDAWPRSSGQASKYDDGYA